MRNNKSLLISSRVRNDEFFTQLSDIKDELMYYKRHFADKVVLCNCNDTPAGNFFKFFTENFKEFRLKKLVAVGYMDNNGTGTIYEYNGKDTATIPLNGTGSFMSDECRELLTNVDIITTNPPFSMFRGFVDLLVKHDKKFLILGNVNAITYRSIYTLIDGGNLWLGSTSPEYFILPSGGVKRVGNVNWFTNLDSDRVNDPVPLTKRYTPEAYPKYDGSDIIEVNRVANIPCDYLGPMGVPITYLPKHCPEQFEIVRVGRDGSKPFSIDGKAVYFRILIKRRG